MKRGIIAAVLLLIIGVCVWRICVLTDSQVAQEAAERWQGASEQRYCQVSVFPADESMTAAKAVSFVSDLWQSVPTGVEPAPILTAFGGIKTGRASYADRSPEVELWHVSEDFFRLHPYEMIRGGVGAFDMEQTAVLNEEAAWQLFGSVNGCGELVRVDGRGYRVVAVLREPSGTANAAAYGNTPRIFLPSEETDPVAFFEAVLPEYYDGCAARMLSDLTGMPVTTNTGRFRLSALYARAKAFFSTPPQALPQFPPWEQAAILTERRLCLLWLLLLLSAALTLSLVWKGIRFYTTRRRTGAPPEN